jgi:hypothetical protein
MSYQGLFVVREVVMFVLGLGLRLGLGLGLR